MLLSLAMVLLLGMFLGWLCKKIKLPSLIGMLATGMILGPYVLGVLDQSILDTSAEIRKIALIIILTRAGLSLDVSGLKKIGRPAIMMCFVPATFELLGIRPPASWTQPFGGCHHGCCFSGGISCGGSPPDGETDGGGIWNETGDSAADSGGGFCG